MIRRLPVLATLVVLIAAGIMVRLGFWQLDRLHQKQAMIAQFRAAAADPAVHPWPDADRVAVPYTRVVLDCRAAGAPQPEAGRNRAGQAGWAQVAACTTPEGGRARIVLGWSARPAAVAWTGGAVTGTYVARDEGAVVFADPPLAGLQPNARPDPRDLPNNHLAYAVQWFAFAAVALVIYALALRKRLRG
ncbi:SURF1 family protein [Novosphingobium sp.]|uniref:SURF1 family protein n=1 Tax=Novosphingobium sp. TaxID=1874826 RepID=UPI00260BD660|nr:SURF1 family protein [Novosphingobium sp.]